MRLRESVLGEESCLAVLRDRLKAFPQVLKEVIDEKAVLGLSKMNEEVLKHIVASGCCVEQKEVWAIYAK